MNQGTLFAVAFSPDRMTVRGTPTPILDDVAYSPVFGYAEMDTSRTGTLVYRRSAGGGQFIVNYGDIARSSGGFFFVRTLWALGALGGFTFILSARGLSGL